MTPIESVLYMIWRGLAIGVLISAPMGPVGILCIQRTLDKGRHAGFYTGIGASISDIFYCLLTGFGLSFIEDFLNENQNIIQLIGSVVLIAFSIYLFKKNPSSALRRPVPQNVSAKKNILGGFLFTFSNPLIIFLIIGLFARFNFTNPEIKGYYYAIGYVFIVAGALGWWYGITYAVSKVRSRFTMKSMKTLNIIIGVVILGFACVGIITSIIGLTSTNAKAQRTFLPAASANISGRHTNTSDTLMLIPIDFDFQDADCYTVPLSFFRLDFKVRNNASAPMKRYSFTTSSGERRHTSLPSWEILAIGEDADTVNFRSKIVEDVPNPYESRQALQFTAQYIKGSTQVMAESHVTISSGIDVTSGWNHFRFENTQATGVTLLAGNRTLKRITSIEDAKALRTLKLMLALSPGASIDIKDIKLTEISMPGIQMPAMGMDEIRQRIAESADPTEGYWQLLDQTMNESLLKAGGNYKIAITKRPDSNYDITYLDGAITNAIQWREGMLKGSLSPTGIDGIYNLKWIDPFGDTLSYMLKAQRESEDLITLQFPYHESTIRFYRVK